LIDPQEAESNKKVFIFLIALMVKTIKGKGFSG
jgi:hypothetical protein